MPQSVCRPKFQIPFLVKMVNINSIRYKNSYFGATNVIHCQLRLLRGLKRGSETFAFYNCMFELCRRHACHSPVSVGFCHAQIFTMGLSLVQRNPTEYGVSKYDHETSTGRRPKHARTL